MPREIFTPLLRDILESLAYIRNHHNVVLMSQGEDFGSHNFESRFLNRPVRVEGIFIGLALGDINQSIIINEQRYSIVRGSIVLFRPGDIVYSSHSTADSYALYLYPSIGEYLRIDLGNILPLLFLLQDRHVLQLSEEELQHLKLLHTEAYRYISRRDTWGEEIFLRLIEVFVLRCGEILEARLSPSRPALSDANKQEVQLLIAFLRLLSKSCSRELSVAYYAERLNTSYKHFSTIIKRASGRSAAEWIDFYLLHEARSLLTYSGLSMQEIAYRLGFSSPSHFSKFFRQHIGISPSSYRPSSSS